MSKVKNAQIENENEVSNVENNESTQTAQIEATETGTIEEQKAQRVLRAKLPALNARNLNFEKRTGNVFTASIVKVFDEDGNAVIENGEQKERLVRKVVEIEIEGENGEVVLLPEYADIKQELEAKRAAAYVLTAETLKEKTNEKIGKLEQELFDAKMELEAMGATLANACEIVMAVSLPEHTAAARVNVTAKLTEATNKLDKMRAMLLAAGLTVEEIDEQLNG